MSDLIKCSACFKYTTSKDIPEFDVFSLTPYECFSTHKNCFFNKYHKDASSNTSRLEAQTVWAFFQIGYEGDF